MMRPDEQPGLSLADYLALCAKERIESVLNFTDWDVQMAAMMMHVSRFTLYRKMRRLGIALPSKRGGNDRS